MGLILTAFRARRSRHGYNGQPISRKVTAAPQLWDAYIIPTGRSESVEGANFWDDFLVSFHDALYLSSRRMPTLSQPLSFARIPEDEIHDASEHAAKSGTVYVMFSVFLELKV